MVGRGGGLDLDLDLGGQFGTVGVVREEARRPPPRREGKSRQLSGGLGVLEGESVMTIRCIQPVGFSWARLAGKHRRGAAAESCISEGSISSQTGPCRAICRLPDVSLWSGTEHSPGARTVGRQTARIMACLLCFSSTSWGQRSDQGWMETCRLPVNPPIFTRASQTMSASY